jgi:hypothetical protein
MVSRWILTLAFASLASAGSTQTVETIEKSFDVPGTPRIVVSNEDGRTELRSHGESRVLVRGRTRGRETLSSGCSRLDICCYTRQPPGKSGG